MAAQAAHTAPPAPAARATPATSEAPASPAVTCTPCQEHDADLWFDPAPGAIARARQLCGQCVLRVECLRAAVQRGEPWGVWGGELFESGRPVGVKRYPGRPRKDRATVEAAEAAALAARLAQVGAA